MITKNKLFAKVGLIVCAGILAFSIFSLMINEAVSASGATNVNPTASNAQIAASMGQSLGSTVSSAVTQPVGAAMQTFDSFRNTVSDGIKAAQVATEVVSKAGILIANPGIGVKALMDQLIADLQIDAIMTAAKENLAGQRALAGQNTAGLALLDSSIGNYATYGATMGAQTARESLASETIIENQNQAMALCPGYTFVAALPAQEKHADGVKNSLDAVAQNLLSGVDPRTQNGANDAAVQLRDAFAAACSTPQMGGAGLMNPELCVRTLLSTAPGVDGVRADVSAIANPLAMQLLTVAYATPQPRPSGFDLATAPTDQLASYWRSVALQYLQTIAVRGITYNMAMASETPGQLKAGIQLANVMRRTGVYTEAEIEKIVPSGGMSKIQFISAMTTAINNVQLQIESSLDPNTAAPIMAQLARLSAKFQEMSLEVQRIQAAVSAAEAIIALDEAKRNNDRSIVSGGVMASANY